MKRGVWVRVQGFVPNPLLCNARLCCHTQEMTWRNISRQTIWLFQVWVSTVHYESLFSKLTPNKVGASTHVLIQCCQLYFPPRNIKADSQSMLGSLPEEVMINSYVFPEVTMATLSFSGHPLTKVTFAFECVGG